MDIKLIAGLIGALLVSIGYIAYIRDIFKRKTKPHAYTWLIWVITMGTAVAALLYGGGGNYAAWGILLGIVMVSIIFLLSFKYGTKT